MATAALITPEILASWPTPNYVNPVSRGRAVEAAAYTTTIAMLLFVGARYYVRENQKAGLGVDDLLLLASAVLATAMAVLFIVMSKHVLGRHIYDVEMLWLVNYAKLNIASIVIYNTCAASTKSSVCLTYLKLFPSRTNRIFCWTMITVLVLGSVSISVLYLLQCIPLAAVWDPTIMKKTCLDGHALLTASAVINVLTDCAVFLWPVAPLWKVKLPLVKRLHLIVVFSAGVLTCVGGILKVVWAQRVFVYWDAPWISVGAAIALLVEFNVGVIAACLPCMRPLLVMFFPAHFGNSSPGRTDYASGGKSWRQGNLQGRNDHSIKLSSREPLEHTESFTHDHLKKKAPGKAWAIGYDASTAQVNPGNGIHISQRLDVDNESAVASERVMLDASSEDWIMKEDTK